MASRTLSTLHGLFRASKFPQLSIRILAPLCTTEKLLVTCGPRLHSSYSLSQQQFPLFARGTLQPPRDLFSHQITKRGMAEAVLNISHIRQRVLLVLSLYDKVNPEKLKVDSHFHKDLGLDSLDHVEIVMAMEDEFGFEIPDVDAQKMLTPADITQYVCDKMDIYDEHEEHHGHDDHGDHGHGHDKHEDKNPWEPKPKTNKAHH